MIYLDYAKETSNGYILNFFADKEADLADISNGKRFVTKNGINYGVPQPSSTVVITMPDKTRKTYILNKAGEWQEGGADIGGNKFAELVQRTVKVATEDDSQGLTSIGDYAFSYCSELTSVTIPDSVTSIGSHAFLGCKKLVDIGKYNNFETIGEGAFNQCNLESFYLSKNLKSLGPYAFTGNKIKRVDTTMSLKEYCEMPIDIQNLKNSYGNIYGYLYINNERLPQDLIIPEQTSKICAGAFYGEQIKSVTVPDSVTVIGEQAFTNCGVLQRVVLGNNIKVINFNTFGHCKRLTSITIPNSVTSIRQYALQDCEGLTSITIPNSVTSIDDEALTIGYYSNKATITMLSTTPPTIASRIFKTIFLNKIIVPKGTSDAYKAATNWSQYADYIEEAAV